jgi:hypothetical protein
MKALDWTQYCYDVCQKSMKIHQILCVHVCVCVCLCVCVFVCVRVCEREKKGGGGGLLGLVPASANCKDQRNIVFFIYIFVKHEKF